jgi:hypothetical protein
MADVDLFSEKKLLLGGLAGLAAAIIGAIVWAVLTVMTNYHQIGWMAVGVGALVGFALRIGNGGNFRDSGRISSALRLHPRKLLFPDRLRVSQGTRWLFHNAEQCRFSAGH